MLSFAKRSEESLEVIEILRLAQDDSLRQGRLGRAAATHFMVSDAILALNRFRRPVGGAQALIMTTYVAAQALIAVSVSTA